MGFSAGSYAKIWEVENKGSYSIANVSVSRRNKETGEFKTEFQHKFVRLVGKAHDMAKELQIPQSGVSIKITSCDVTNKYDGDAKREYVNFVIFGMETNNNESTTAKKASTKSEAKSKQKEEPVIECDDDELPF